MRVSDGVFDVVVIFLTLALSVSCTGTWFTWRRDFKLLAQKTPKIGSTVEWQKIYWKVLEFIMISKARFMSQIGYDSQLHLRPHPWPA